MSNDIKALSDLKRMMLIINPVSGRRTSLRFLPDIIKIFNEHGYVVSVFPTGSCGDAIKLCERYSNDFEIVVCIGGDGTLNETVSGIVRSCGSAPIGYIPSGSTNDFAACHKLSSDLLTAALNIAEGTPIQLDIGQFGDRYFSYIAAFGAFSWLSYKTPQNLKNIFGHSAYILDAVKDLPKIKAHHLRFNLNGSTCEDDYIFGAICNSTSIAGTISLPSDVVDTSDGKFEVLLVHKPQTLADFQSILTGILSQDYSSPFIDFYQTERLSIEAPENLIWSLDGERCDGAKSFEVINLNKRLTLIS